jgi:hypothetical protein
MLPNEIKKIEHLLNHPIDFFKQEHIQQRAAKSEQSPERVENMSWLVEVANHIFASLNEHIVLRGGTLSQAKVGDAKARTSADIDGLFCGRREDLEAAISDFNNKFKEAAPFLQFKSFDRTEKPMAGLLVWHCYIPQNIGSRPPSKAGAPGRILALELHVLGGKELPPNEVLNTEIFEMKLENGQGLTLGALLADKLNCLAIGQTIALPEDEHQKQTRQIYDLSMLSEVNPITDEVLKDAAKSVAYFTEYHSASQGHDVPEPANVMSAASAFLSEWGWPKNVSASPSKGKLKSAQDYSGNIPHKFRTNDQGWGVRALRLAILAEAIKMTMKKDSQLALRWYKSQYNTVAKLLEDDSLEETAEFTTVLLLEAGLAPRDRKSCKNQLLGKHSTAVAKEKLAWLYMVLVVIKQSN